MKSNKINLFFLILWFVLSWGLIVFSKFGKEINQIILKIIVPILFFILFFIERGKLKFSSALIIYIVFTIWASVSVLYTVNMEMTLKYLQMVVGNVLLWYLTYRLLYYFSNKNLFFFILGGAFLFHALYGIFVPPEDEIITRISGIYTNPNALGFAMWYGIIIFSYFYISSYSRGKKILLPLILIILVWTLIYSASRKSFLAFLVSVGVILFYKNFKNFKKFIIIVPIIIFIYIVSSDYIMLNTPLGERLNSENVERSTNVRTKLISEGVNMFIENPFRGVGLGSFTSYSSSGLMSHNDYIEVLSSMGIIGFIIYFSIFIFFYKQTKILFLYEETYYFGIISRAFIFGYLILGMGRPSFLDPVAILVFASFQGMVEYIVIEKNIVSNNKGKD